MSNKKFNWRKLGVIALRALVGGLVGCAGYFFCDNFIKGTLDKYYNLGYQSGYSEGDKEGYHRGYRAADQNSYIFNDRQFWDRIFGNSRTSDDSAIKTAATNLTKLILRTLHPDNFKRIKSFEDVKELYHAAANLDDELR